MSINAIHSFNAYTRPMTQHTPAPKFGAVLPLYEQNIIAIDGLKNRVEQCIRGKQNIYIGQVKVGDETAKVIYGTGVGFIALLSPLNDITTGGEEYRRLIFDSPIQVPDYELTVEELKALEDLNKLVENSDSQNLPEWRRLGEGAVNPFALITGSDDLERLTSQPDDTSWIEERLRDDHDITNFDELDLRATMEELEVLQQDRSLAVQNQEGD